LGELQIFISVADWRQFLTKIDPANISEKMGKSLHGRIKLITILSSTDFLALLVSIGLAIPAFGWWAFFVIPVVTVVWIFYKARANRGRQTLIPVSVLLVAAIATALLWNAPNIWIRLFIISATLSIFLVRLLYYAVASIVFDLIHTNYEFFDAFYLQPEGAMVPLIWVEPPLAGSSEI
jgi:hypothetical protein